MPIKKSLLKFLLLISASYGLWFICYEYYLKPSGHLDHIITEYVTIGICHLLDISGYISHYTIALKHGETYIFVEPFVLPTVRVGASCNGLELLVLFSLFIICYPGQSMVKIPFVVFGNLLIHGINILRNYWLTLMTMQHSPFYDLFHRYIFIFMVYGAIFVLWILWTNHFSGLNIHFKSHRLIVITLGILLLLLSLLKDYITPDYLNTPSAAFLSPKNLQENPFFTISTHPIFWLLSFLYSAIFILLPTYLIKLLYNKQMASYIFGILLFIALSEYALLFSQQTSMVYHILPKINRYFHSPIMLLFFIAALQLNFKKDGLNG